MIAGSVARRYARALGDVAATSGDLERVRQDLRAVADLMRRQPGLREFVANPSVLRRDKARVFEQVVAKMALRPLTIAFLRIILEAGRLAALESIVRAYEALVDERLGRVKAVVTSAVPLDPEQEERLRQRLTQVTGKAVYLETQHNPGILGGLIAQIGSMLYDGSLRTQLTRLREQLVRG